MLTSFVVNVDQINHMVIANDNMYTFNQRMKTYFVHDQILPMIANIFTKIYGNDFFC
jgi:hypothetical protein